MVEGVPEFVDISDLHTTGISVYLSVNININMYSRYLFITVVCVFICAHTTVTHLFLSCSLFLSL